MLDADVLPVIITLPLIDVFLVIDAFLVIDVFPVMVVCPPTETSDVVLIPLKLMFP